MGTCLTAAGRVGQLLQLLSSNMMRVVIALTCLVAVSQAGVMEKIHRDFQTFNNNAMCWGHKNALENHVALIQATEQCMQFGTPAAAFVKPANPFAQLTKPFNTLPQPINNRWNDIFAGLLNRNKRQAEGGLIETDEADLEEFLEDFADWKGDLASKIGNLTCVLTKLNMLDSNLQVNIDFYTNTAWQRDLSGTLAGSDPEWKQSVITGYRDCYQIAENFPQQSLDRNPLYKVFGRHMVFFNCVKKVDEKACAAAQMNKYLEVMYGEDDGETDWTKFGLPKNKYEQAALITLVMYESASPEENFIGDFFNGKSEF